MPAQPTMAKAEAQEHLNRWRIEADKYKKLWNQLRHGGSQAAQIVEILDALDEAKADLDEEKAALAHRKAQTNPLSKAERVAFAARIEHLDDVLEGYASELDTLPDNVRDAYQRAYEEAKRIMEHLVRLHHECEAFKLENSAQQIAAELHVLGRCADEARDQLILEMHVMRADDATHPQALQPQTAPPKREHRRIIRPAEGRIAAYQARIGKPSPLAQVSRLDNALAKSHSRMGYRQMRRYFGIAY